MYNDLISAIMLGVNNRKNIMKNINEKVNAKKQSRDNLISMSNKVVQEWFKQEDAFDKSAQALADIVRKNITTKQGKINLERIAVIKLETDGIDKAKSFKSTVSRIGKQLGVKETLKVSEKKGTAKFSAPSNSGKGGNNQKAQPKDNSDTIKKFKDSVVKGFKTLSLQDQKDLIDRLQVEWGSKKALANVNKAPAKKVANQK